jgi:hypothetical protein
MSGIITKKESLTTKAALTLGVITAVLLTAGFANVGGMLSSVVQTAAAQVQEEEDVDQPITQGADQDQTVENNQPITQDADQDQILENNQDNDLQNDQDIIQSLDQGESNSGGDGPTTFGDDSGFLNADQTNDQDATNNNEQNPVQTSDQDATATNTDQCVLESPMETTGGENAASADFSTNNCFNTEDSDSTSPF